MLHELHRGLVKAALILLIVDLVACTASSCTSDIDAFVQQQLPTVSGPPKASKMLFFLHMPRTAGRTYHSCFLKTATPPSRRCEKSYDVLRLNASIPSCGLLSSHDDMSLMDNLPDDAAFVTQLR